MGVTVTSSIIVAGHPDRLRQIDARLKTGDDAVEDVIFAEDGSLEIVCYNGVGGLLRYHGDRIAAAHPDVGVRGFEFYDCSDDPTLARWERGQCVYFCDLYGVFSCGGPDDHQPLVRLWHQGDGVAQAVTDWNLTGNFGALEGHAEIAPRWHHLASSGAHLLLRRPSKGQADGVAIWLEPWGGQISFIQAIDELGLCRNPRRESIAWASRRFPEIRSALRNVWRAEADTRRRGRRDRNLWKRLRRRAAETGRSAMDLFCRTDPDRIPF
ncbi:hypothetical protein [Acetobacter sp. UBA5411]|uniref:hypothetical protein n=1 Tax=Acetobacter sp. UBA5411 TaxID=1945905 RepID=UPI0025C1D72B|nr:hypothetical protein [Acetobacter sp. UBA5411]